MNSTPQKSLHKPVMIAEVMEAFQIKPNSWYLDATFGRGGHTQKIIELGGKVIALDQDQEAIEFANRHLNQLIENKKLIIYKQNFVNLSQAILQAKGQAEIASISGILFDLGTSLDQIRAPHRGFSFDLSDSPLDMRMDQELGVSAADLLTVLSIAQLASAFRDLGGESHARIIAKAIDRYRQPDRSRRIETVDQLVSIILSVKQRRSHLHPATKVFQALRILVNSELEHLTQALPQALDNLENEGKLVTIAFHQGEDSIIKHQFKEWEVAGLGFINYPKPLQPTLSETDNNPSARSAKLRLFTKSNNENKQK